MALVPIPSLKDLLAVLDRWGDWKRMRETPTRVDALEREVAELRRMLSERPAPKTCKYCGEGPVVPTGRLIERGRAMIQRMHCKACDKVGEEIVNA